MMSSTTNRSVDDTMKGTTLKRDMDLVRLLLLRLEELEIEDGALRIVNSDDDEMSIDGFDEHQISYHLRLILEAGFVDAGKFRPMSGGFDYRGLTWGGHEFLDSIRDAAVWRETKDAVKEVGGFSVDLIKALAKGFIKKKIEMHTGIPVDI